MTYDRFCFFCFIFMFFHRCIGTSEVLCIDLHWGSECYLIYLYNIGFGVSIRINQCESYDMIDV
jgi:hypothetical protein